MIDWLIYIHIKVPLGVIDKNETYTKEMIGIMQELHKYVSMVKEQVNVSIPNEEQITVSSTKWLWSMVVTWLYTIGYYRLKRSMCTPYSSEAISSLLQEQGLPSWAWAESWLHALA